MLLKNMLLTLRTEVSSWHDTCSTETTDSSLWRFLLGTTTYGDANNFVNAKNHAEKKPLLTGYMSRVHTKIAIIFQGPH